MVYINAITGGTHNAIMGGIHHPIMPGTHNAIMGGIYTLIRDSSFTMHGVTKQIDLPFDLYGPLKDAFGQVRLGIQASLIINRQDYGVKWNQKLDSGGLAVSNDVDIEINLEATPAA